MIPDGELHARAASVSSQMPASETVRKSSRKAIYRSMRWKSDYQSALMAREREEMRENQQHGTEAPRASDESHHLFRRLDWVALDEGEERKKLFRCCCITSFSDNPGETLREMRKEKSTKRLKRYRNSDSVSR